MEQVYTREQLPVRTWISYSRLFGKKVHPQTLRARLRRFNRTGLVTILSKINNLLYGAKWGQHDKGMDVDQYLIDSFIAPAIRGLPEFVSARSDNNAVFHRQQILLLLRLAFLHGASNGNADIRAGDDSGFALGELCLIINDALEPKRLSNSLTGHERKVRRHLGLQMAPSFELRNPARTDRAVARSDIIYTDILTSPEMQRAVATSLRGFDLQSAFIKATGLSIAEYRDFVYLVLAWYGQDIEDFLSGRATFTINRNTYFKETEYPQSSIDGYLTLDSVPLDTIAAEIRKASGLPPIWDFTAFRQHPLVELDGGNLICVDPSFLLDKLSSGLFWTIFNSFQPSSTERDRTFQAFGYLFELYVSRVMEQICQASRQPYLAFPEFGDGDEASDGIIPIGQHLILIESKSGQLTAPAKYSGRMKTFLSDLDKKFISGKTAGVTGLANRIERMFNRDKKKRAAVLGLAGLKQTITRVTPVIVTQEPFFRFDFMNEFLNSAFVKILAEKSVSPSIVVSTLQVVDIESLERIRANILSGAASYTFEQCVNLRSVRDVDLRSSFFTFMWLHYPEFRNNKDAEIEQRFDKVFRRITTLAFGKAPPSNFGPEREH